jgi:hypothetical protein
MTGPLEMIHFVKGMAQPQHLFLSSIPPRQNATGIPPKSHVLKKPVTLFMGRMPDMMALNQIMPITAMERSWTKPPG